VFSAGRRAWDREVVPGCHDGGVWCPACGFEYRTGFSWCPDCEVVLVDKRPARIPPPMADHEQLEYDLSDFTPERREAVTFWLVTSEIPFEWEPDGLLVVPSKWQLEVDAIVESMESPDAGRAGEVGAYPAEMIDAGPPELASPARRLAGYLIDYVVITAAAVIATAIFGVRSAGVTVSVLLVNTVYIVGSTAIWGRTVGKLVVHTEVVRRDGIAPPGFRVALIRYLVVALALPLRYFGGFGGWLGVGWTIAVYAPILGRERRGLHDRAAGTDVVRSR
jgi:uncharacterized RDD family membrane protein YckC